VASWFLRKEVCNGCTQKITMTVGSFLT